MAIPKKSSKGELISKIKKHCGIFTNILSNYLFFYILKNHYKFDDNDLYLFVYRSYLTIPNLSSLNNKPFYFKRAISVYEEFRLDGDDLKAERIVELLELSRIQENLSSVPLNILINGDYKNKSDYKNYRDIIEKVSNK